MHLETIRDSHHQVIGYIATDARGHGTARDAHLRLLGRYNAQRDVTYDAHNQLVGQTNLLAALVHRAAGQR